MPLGLQAATPRHVGTAISRELQAILGRPGPDTAAALSSDLAHDPAAWLPESMALLCTPRLRPQQVRRMVEGICPGMPAGDIPLCAAVLATFGRLGFAFPQWRFLAAARGGQSLLERFGMRRLHRPDDVFPPGHPSAGEDRFGPGFAVDGPGWYIEYRRAYLLCFLEDTAVLVRNSSRFFGRSSLADPVYVRQGKLSRSELEGFGQAGIAEGWDAWPAGQSGPLLQDGRLAGIDRTLGQLERFDRGLTEWIFRPGDTGGLAYVADFLAACSEGSAPMPWLARMDSSMPPWFPHGAVQAGAGLVCTLRKLDAAPGGPDGDLVLAQGRWRPVLLSSPSGDLP